MTVFGLFDRRPRAVWIGPCAMLLALVAFVALCLWAYHWVLQTLD